MTVYMNGLTEPHLFDKAITGLVFLELEVTVFKYILAQEGGDDILKYV